jgi:hypothetical protein
MAGETCSDYVAIRCRDAHLVVTRDRDGASVRAPR